MTLRDMDNLIFLKSPAGIKALKSVHVSSRLVGDTISFFSLLVPANIVQLACVPEHSVVEGN